MAQAPCHYCGNLVDVTAQFCSRCGSHVSWTPPSAVDPSPPYQQPGYSQEPYQPPPYQQPYSQGARETQPYHQPPVYGADPRMMPLYVQPKDKNAAVLLAIFLGGWTWVYTYKRDAWKFWLSLGLHLTLLNPLWTWVLLFIPNIGLYVWSIVDVAVKPQHFYDNYPYG